MDKDANKVLSWRHMSESFVLTRALAFGSDLVESDDESGMYTVSGCPRTVNAGSIVSLVSKSSGGDNPLNMILVRYGDVSGKGYFCWVFPEELSYYYSQE